MTGVTIIIVIFIIIIITIITATTIIIIIILLMNKKKFFCTVDELERNIKTASEKGLERITKMQNLSQNEFKSQKCKTNREMN